MVAERVREWVRRDVPGRRIESVAAGFSPPVGGLKAAATPFRSTLSSRSPFDLELRFRFGDLGKPRDLKCLRRLFSGQDRLRGHLANSRGEFETVTGTS